MNNITVGRYSNPKGIGWLGWMEPKDKSWIIFIDLNNNPKVYLNRDPKTGAIL